MVLPALDPVAAGDLALDRLHGQPEYGSPWLAKANFVGRQERHIGVRGNDHGWTLASAALLGGLEFGQHIRLAGAISA